MAKAAEGHVKKRREQKEPPARLRSSGGDKIALKWIFTEAWQLRLII
jgi:hypothetical protein